MSSFDIFGNKSENGKNFVDINMPDRGSGQCLDPASVPIAQPPVKENVSGSARMEGWSGKRRPWDMLAWVASRDRKKPHPRLQAAA